MVRWRAVRRERFHVLRGSKETRRCLMGVGGRGRGRGGGGGGGEGGGGAGGGGGGI
jgi:hypothetical protein